MTMKRTISGMIGAGSLAHNRRDFIAENVDPDRVHLNICYQNENLKQVYKELFDESVERYNVGKRKDRQITNYYEKIRQGKQEKLFHEVIFQIGNSEDMAAGTPDGELAVKVLDVYIQDFQKRNPTLRVFSCYLHQDEATPHLHIDFVPYVTGWKGKGMDTRVSLKQALKSLGFQGGNKHDTELNQWINHEKEVLAEIAREHGIEWEQKGTHEEHLDVYNFKKKERKKEVQALEQEKEYLTAENEGLTSQIAEIKADIKMLEEEKNQAQKDKEMAEQRAEKAEKELKNLEQHREQLQPIMDSVNKELREVGTIELLLPEAGPLERAATYRDKKIKPLFIKMKNKIAAMAAQVKELAKDVDNWKRKYQKTKQEYNGVQRELDDMRKENRKLFEEKEILQGIFERYDSVVRVMGMDTVDAAVQQDIQNQKALEEKRRMEQMPKGSIRERLEWGVKKSEMDNQKIKKNKTKYGGMER
ncbi:MAG: plasmid recombination protein [[Clostridium] scindens]|uniref:plasmid recombination protein n=1 Tax=Clostridia TaxID=186801 RepID=UPI00242B407E|nr:MULTISPECIES: plasmid recombination protein [Clostridia]MCI6394997.1 plasmid recombination protein [[Clostridium] scindens]MDY4867400.1 plasmid recombination protein [[Clostridium] scindens]MDY5286884.1 plasmid recombination protein [Lentihominibacter sp.]